MSSWPVLHFPVTGLIPALDSRLYGAYGANWDDDLLRRHILGRLNPSSRVLDVGAGAGRLPAMNFRNHAGFVTGIDLDPSIGVNTHIHAACLGNAEHLPFLDASFDIVVADNVFEHVESPLLVFTELARVLRPGGRFILKTPNRHHYVTLLSRLTPQSFHRWINRIRGRGAEHTYRTFYRANTAKSLRHFARLAGLIATDVAAIEGRPEYMRMNAALYLAGWAYERLVNSGSWGARFRLVLLGEFMKPSADQPGRPQESRAVPVRSPGSGRPGSRLAYLARVARVYASPASGPLSFWHESPLLNDAGCRDGREYYMRFQQKANYPGPFDSAGVPLLDYRGDIGRQHNPIAIAQYGLARFNRWCRGEDAADHAAWLTVAGWLAEQLTPNSHGIPMWLHHFDWPYRQTLRAPWYSGLAQGNGLSMLVRAAQHSDDPSFAAAAHRAFESMRLDVSKGGVIATDPNGDVWIEEYMVDPPSHILNGFVWALWGVYDYARWSGDAAAWTLWNAGIATLSARLADYDTGWWSLYELPVPGATPMLASRYYHTLHITQLHVLHRLTGDAAFRNHAARFAGYLGSRRNVARAFAAKALFKLRHY